MFGTSPQRASSYGSLRASTLGAVEHGQTSIMDQNHIQHKRSKHRRGNKNSSNTTTPQTTASTTTRIDPPHQTLDAEETPLLKTSSTSSLRAASSIPSMLELYNKGLQEETTSPFVDSTTTIRFQVVVWHIGQVDMVQARVPATFRITIYWNVPSLPEPDDIDDSDLLSQQSIGSSSKATSWKMHGRQKAIQQAETTDLTNVIEVPAVSLLNVETFTTVGEPEVLLLNEETKLMRWSCMYRATLFQDQWEVDNFPHDEHDIKLRLAILAQRESGAQWDRNIWKIDLARESDSMGSLRVPHGLVVSHVNIPEFRYNKTKGLQFEFTPLDHGSSSSGASLPRSKDKCLEVKLKVWRNSSYYDRNIMPLLGMLNAVAISITALEDQRFFQRALLTLNIAFVEIGMRMTVDSKLPSASYQIKMQRILNEYFFGLLFLVLESLLVYELREFGFQHTSYIDWAAAIGVLLHNCVTQCTFYYDAHLVNIAVDETSPTTTLLPK